MAVLLRGILMRRLATSNIFLLCFVFGLASPGLAEKPKRGVAVSPANAETVPITGDYWALIIGIDKYKHVEKLDSAVKDATALRELLVSRYGFAASRVTMLLDGQATREGIEDALYQLGKQAKADDSVLIYYAGHGQTDPEAHRGFWVPVDGKAKSPGTLISNARIRDEIEAMRARHVYLVADSCFAGSLFGKARALPSIDDKFFARLYSNKSRWALTSGQNEPVSDGGKEGHSVFAYFFLKLLKDNTDAYLVPSRIYEDIAKLVTNNSSQQPRSQPLAGAGDEGGQFVFRLAVPSKSAGNVQVAGLPRTTAPPSVKPRPSVPDILREAGETATKIEEKHRFYYLALIADTQLQTGNKDGASQTLRRLEELFHAETKDNAHWFHATKVAELQAQTGQMEQALQTLQAAVDAAKALPHREATSPFQNLARAYMAIGKHDEALSVLRQVLPIDADPWTFRDVLKLIKSSQTNDSVKDALFKEVIGGACSQRTDHLWMCRAELAAALASIDDVEGALKIFKEEAERLKSENQFGISTASVVYQGLLGVLVENGHVAIAEQIAESIPVSYGPDGKPRDIQSRDNWIHPIIRALGRKGDVQGVRRNMQRIRLAFYGDNEALVEAQVLSGDLDGARQTAQTITEDTARQRVLEEIALAQASKMAKAGNIPGARVIAGAISSKLSRDSAFLQIAIAQIEAGDEAGARTTLQDVDLKSSIAFDLKRNLVKALLDGGNLAGAMEFAPVTGELSAVLAAQAKAGDVEAALQVAETQTPYNKVQLLLAIAKARAEVEGLLVKD